MWTVEGHIKHTSYVSVKLRSPDTNEIYWLDVAVVNGDIEADWNQYIFVLTDPEDVQRRDYQDDTNNLDDASSTAICYLEKINMIKQLDDGTWQKGDLYYGVYN